VLLQNTVPAPARVEQARANQPGQPAAVWRGAQIFDASPALDLVAVKTYLSELVAVCKRAMRTPPHAYEKMMGVGKHVSANTDEHNRSVTWGVAYPPRARVFTTCSPLQEFELVLWVYACTALIQALGRLEAGSADAETSALCVSAAQAFRWKSRTAPVTPQAEYRADAPLHMKAFICKGLEYLAQACWYVCEAECERRENKMKAEVCPDLQRAEVALGSCIRILRNEKGGDCAPAALMEQVQLQLAYVGVWTRAYEAVAFFKNIEAADEYRVIDALADAKSALRTLFGTPAAIFAFEPIPWLGSIWTLLNRSGANGAPSAARTRDLATAEVEVLILAVERLCKSPLAYTALRDVNYYVSRLTRGDPRIPAAEHGESGGAEMEYDWRPLFSALLTRK
jgi:hypothetical protein